MRCRRATQELSVGTRRKTSGVTFSKKTQQRSMGSSERSRGKLSISSQDVQRGQVTEDPPNLCI